MEKSNLNHAEMLSVLTKELAKFPVDPYWEETKLLTVATTGYMFGLCDRLYNEYEKFVAVNKSGLHLYNSKEDVIKYETYDDTFKVFEIHSVKREYSIEEIEIKK
jgi:hypothetical protein